MEEARNSERRFLAAGLAVSLLLHVLVAVALVTNFQLSVPEPPINPIEVELVPETEPQTEEAEIPEPEEVQPEEAEPEAPAPVPAPPAAEQAEAQEPPAPSEAPVMQPVEEFGEEDTGPQALEEETADEVPAAEEEVAAEAAPGSADTSNEPAPQEPEPARPDEQDVAAADEVSEPQENPELQSGAETEAEADTADEQAEEGAVDGEAPAEDFGTVGPIVTAVRPARKPARPSAPPATEETESPGGGGAAAGMLSARELFSDDILSDPRARTAMRGMPPGERLNLLCMTELRAQLTVTSPQPPELLPTFRPRSGNVLEPARAAFRSGGRWYDVAFRCETDSDVTRVQKFDFRIGRPIPPGEWAERGLAGF